MTWEQWLDALATIAAEARGDEHAGSAPVHVSFTLEAHEPERAPARAASLEIVADGARGDAQRFDVVIQLDEPAPGDRRARRDTWRRGGEFGVLELDGDVATAEPDRAAPRVFDDASELAAWVLDCWRARA